MTKKSIVPFLVRRYLRFNHSQPFISIAAILAFIGVSIGVMVLIVAMALMNGFDKEFERKLFIMNYPLSVLPSFNQRVTKDDLSLLEQKFPNLTFSPFIRSQAIAKSGQAMEGAMVFGVDFTRESRTNPVFKEAYLKAKDFSKNSKFEVIIGNALKKSFFLRESESLMLIFTQLSPNAISISPTIKRFNVIGDFTSGLIAYDKSYIYTSLEALQIIKNMQKDTYDGIHIYTKNPQKDIEAIKETLPHLHTIGWWEQNGNFFAALALEKRALFIVLMLIILVASLNIISSLLMTVMNRRKEIALLLTMGASPKEIKKTFLYLGNLIGIGGIITGCILAGILLLVLSNFSIISLPEDVYGYTKLPLELSFFDFCMILLGSFVIVFLSSYYPAKKATQVDPLQVLRNE